MGAPRKLILRSFQRPGDVVMLMCVVRDQQRDRRRQLGSDISVATDALWLTRLHISCLQDGTIELTDLHHWTTFGSMVLKSPPIRNVTRDLEDRTLHPMATNAITLPVEPQEPELRLSGSRQWFQLEPATLSRNGLTVGRHKSKRR